MRFVGAESRVHREVFVRIDFLADIADGLERGPHERIEAERFLVELDRLARSIRFGVHVRQYLQHMRRILVAVLFYNVIVELVLATAATHRS